MNSCRGHPNLIQCIRAYFSNRFRLRHRAVQDPVEYRNIGKRNQVATSFQDRREDQQESRVDNLHDVYDDLLKATSSDFQGSDDKRAAVDFRSIGRRSFGADFRNIGKRYLGADFRNIGKRMNAADFRQIGKRGYAVDFRNIGKRLGVDFRNIGKRTVLKSDNVYLLSLLCSDTSTMAQCADRIASNTYIWQGSTEI